MAATLVWSDTDGLDKYRLILVQNPPASDIYVLERSQQTDALGADIWQPYAEIPGELCALLLQSVPPEPLKGVDFRRKIGVRSIDPVTQIAKDALPNG